MIPSDSTDDSNGMKHDSIFKMFAALSKQQIEQTSLPTLSHQRRGCVIMDVCNVCGVPAPTRCSGCKKVSYCGKEHQKQDWKAHKPQCLLLRSAPNAVDEGKKGEYLGTFRWGADTKFMKLPKHPEVKQPSVLFARSPGWQAYMGVRLDDGTDDETPVSIEPSLLDGMSYPVSLAYGIWFLQRAGLVAKDGPLEVIAIGAAAKTEQRLLMETDYFADLPWLLPDNPLTLTMVGPEVATKAGSGSNGGKREFTTANGGSLKARCVRGPVSDVFDHPASADIDFGASPSSTVVVGFNTGMGCGNFKLMKDWLPDISTIVASGVPSLFFCANDYGDVRGEMPVMQLIHHANFVLKPTANPYKALTTMHEPGKQQTAWSCGNSFVYAIRGCGNVPLRGKDAVGALTKICEGLQSGAIPLPESVGAGGAGGAGAGANKK